jgi:hypothetical protein
MTLYHYCGNESFVAIVEGRSLLASELSLSNDHLEGKWVRGVFSEVCQQNIKDKYNFDMLMQHFDLLYKVFGARGFCLSEESDLLSQWRGYANDGAGISIGFSNEYLEKLTESSKSVASTAASGFSLQKVVYDVDKQKAEMLPNVSRILETLDAGAFRPREGTLLTPTSEEEKN